MRFNIRLQHWVLVSTVAIVLTLTIVFFAAILGKFQALTHSNAKDRFELEAQQASSQLLGLMNNVGSFVNTQSRSNLHLFEDETGHINPDGVIDGFISSLAIDYNLYGHYFALNNDEFVQVIAVRRHPQLAAFLQAPSDTWFAIRRIRQLMPDTRLEEWQFLNQKREKIGQLQKSTDYHPTQRPWYSSAQKSQKLAVTDPYLFASTQALGITLSHALTDHKGVLGTDINLSELQAFLDRLSLSPNAGLMVLDAQNRVIAHSLRGEAFKGVSIPALVPLSKIAHPAAAEIAKIPMQDKATLVDLPTSDQGIQPFVLVRNQTAVLDQSRFQVLVLAPVSDFTGPIDQTKKDILWIIAGVLLLLLPLSLLGSRQVARALVQLAHNSERLRLLDFSEDPKESKSFLYEINILSDAQQVMHRSIKARTRELNLAQDKLAQLVRNGLLLAKERDRKKLLQNILKGGQELANCEAATLFLKTEHNTLSFAMRTNDDELPPFEVPLYHPETGEPMTGYVSSYVALKNETILINNVYTETRFDLSGTKRFSEESGFKTISMLTVPLSLRDGDVLGVIQLMNAKDPSTGEIIPFPEEMVSFVEALAAQSAVTLENLQLIEAQKQLVDSIIQIIAGAIDAKSPYTGGHCERVPELAEMLAQEASQATEGSLASFAFTTEDEWREFRIGAWLHDCGKVTTPEYVVDKATKLETIYNRIHEVRTRFEVLLRDAMIARLEAVANGVPEAEAASIFEEQAKTLKDDFAFVAECNVGGEFMAPEKVERLKQIAERTWWRHFDDYLGLSHEELRRYESSEDQKISLPVQEKLLADKPWHKIVRTDWRPFDPKYGFQMKVPENLYHFGEIYNLSVSRGTLTEEERFKINEHIIQTIVMLDNMPFPKHLKRVPEYAGTHHETLIGTGYPRKLTAQELSVPARIMAIADIFEALTASDRPYKKPKTLSEAIKILWFFKKDQHIDGELFDLFLTSGSYKRYAERFLKPEQIDEVDITPFLTPKPEKAPAA